MNGGRERILPADEPEKWNLFKSYNQRDVEVEMEIVRRLAHVPVPESVWEEYRDSELINDRGIGVDRELVEKAIALDAQSQEELVEGLRELTDLENPRSVSQMREWLAENGFELDSLGRKEVEAVMRTAPEPFRTVLILRQEVAKSSVKHSRQTLDGSFAQEIANTYNIGGGKGRLKPMKILAMGFEDYE